MILLEDKNQKVGKHETKHRYWASVNVGVVTDYRLPVGDYILMNEKIKSVIDRKSKRGIPVKQMDLLGTYDVVVDTKDGMAELEQNLTGKGYERFRDSLILAQNNGIKMFVLIEDRGSECTKTIHNKPCKSIRDVFSWKNPRLFVFSNGKQKYPKAKHGSTIAKQMMTIEKQYGCKFVFCNPLDSGETVLELLEGGYDGC